MKVYCIFYYTELEKIFSSKKKAEEYMANLVGLGYFIEERVIE